jgi:hypothetical protein
MFRIRVAALLLGAIFSATCGSVQAGVISGDPSSDGWSYVGNSLATGTFIRNAGGGSTFFDVYSQSFIVDANSSLITGAPGTGWLAGDTIIGLGATLFSYNGATIFAKFGSSAALFQPDSNGSASPAGDGKGSFSAGHGGFGSIQISNAANPLSSGGALNNGGSVTRFPDVYVYNGSSSVQVASGGAPAAIADVSRLAYLWNNSVNTLSSFEVFLNVSLAARLGDPLAPAPGDKFDLNVSNRSLQGTDAYGRSAAVSASVPEPASLTVWGLGLVGFTGMAWRKRKRSA